ncbi:Alpha,alpha-trehalose phosphorylase OS=Streptomyces griseomycini OX=66895 GN=FHS37_005438 PE=3 SV=1 [Streptomyces griseomycini]
MDLADLEHNTRDGLHIASLAGTWTALPGFGGMRWDDGGLRFTPRLPPRLRRLAFTVRFLGRSLRVEITADRAAYTLRSGPPLTVRHHGAELTVREGAPVERPLPPSEPRPAPGQPPHRAPHPR